ncbi:alpha/beta hydrolase fold [Filimonas lacunae]|nr:alpha/beta hydrolase fold [Filimonas lacunae]
MLFAQSEKDITKVKKEISALIDTTIYGRNKAAGKFYTIRGIKMYCEQYGKGEPLLIIHGNGGSINNFVKQIPYFSRKYRVIIADSRAQGKTIDNASDSLSYEMMADDYAALLTALHIDSANVIGWSDGGINGLLLAIRHPEKVKKLAITGANLEPDTSAVDPGIVTMITPDWEKIKNSRDTTVQARNQRKLFRLLVEEPHIPVSNLHTIKAPTLVMAGDHDVLRVRHTVQIFENIPNAYLWIFPNSGHSTPLVYPDEFNKKVDAFFQSSYRRIEGEKRFF